MGYGCIPYFFGEFRTKIIRVVKMYVYMDMKKDSNGFQYFKTKCALIRDKKLKEAIFVGKKIEEPNFNIKLNKAENRARSTFIEVGHGFFFFL